MVYGSMIAIGLLAGNVPGGALTMPKFIAGMPSIRTIAPATLTQTMTRPRTVLPDVSIIEADAPCR